MKNLILSLVLLSFVLPGISNPLPPYFWESLSVIKKNSHAEISWKVNNPDQVSYFDIELFNIVGEWETIGTVRTDGSVNEFRFNDPSPAYGQNHYRIVMTDVNGNRDISSVVTLHFIDNAGFTFSPNPSTGGKIKVLLPEVTRICIYNSNGNEVFCTPFAMGTYNLDVSGLKKGNYLIKAGGKIKQLVIQ